jgi:hypothetical protein
MKIYEKAKDISSLNVEETIKLLEKSSEELRQTPYTRFGLIMRLVILKSGVLTTSDKQTRTRAVEHLGFILLNGSYEDKAFVRSFN